MKIHPTDQFRTKALVLVSMLLLLATVFLTVFITHQPQEISKRITYITEPPPSRPPASGRFTTLPLGSRLPSETACASRVRRSSWEPRPDNFAANHRVPTATQIAGLAPWTTSSLGIQLNDRADSIRKQISGNFTGTTDEIFQWVACKWGIDEDIVRAEAVVESKWHQSQLGDNTTDKSYCPPGNGYPGAWNGSSCYQSYGILQIKYVDFKYTWPMNRDDTAFNAEYMYGWLRSCYEGWQTYLSTSPWASSIVSGYPPYHAGDLWGCVGRWYSGNWYDQTALGYINWVETELANNEWLQPGF